MRNNNTNGLGQIAKSAMIVASVFASLFLIAVIYLTQMNGATFISQIQLPNIMPILMALIGFFAIGYAMICLLTSNFFNGLALKKPDYSYLQY